MSAQARPMTGPTAGLLALDLGLAAVLAVLWLAPGAPAQWRTWQAPQPQPPSLDDIDAAQLTPNPAAGAAYPGVLQRPLMDPARRPQAAASAPAAAAAAPPPPAAIEKIKLLGIVAGPALSGVLIANSRSQAVTDTKLEELTREVREHNNFARRVPILEEQMKVANHRIADLEKERN